MRPDDTTGQSHPTVRVPNRDAGYSLVPSRQHPASSRDSSSAQQATANIARDQIDAIYANDPNSLMAVESEPSSHDPSAPALTQTQPQPEPSDAPVATTPTHAYAPTDQPMVDTTASSDSHQPQILHGKSKFHHDREPVPVASLIDSNPYDRSHDESKLQANESEWKQYHTAWQNYYQQYYHRYYSSHIQQIQSELQAKGSTPATAIPTFSPNPGDVTPEQAMEDIRSSLRNKISQRTRKVRKSRHFMPIAAALSVMLVFAFLQYNRVLFSNINAYIVPSNLEPTNLIIDPTLDTTVSPEPKLIIPKVNIDVPVVWDAKPDQASQMAAMEHGVAWFGIPGANSKPGQIGNTVLSGHSSNDFLEAGDYKFVFAPLHRIGTGDTIYINYEGKRYTYTVTKIDVVMPTDVDALRYPTDKPMLTLITCTPLGTANKRLLVTAEQVLPDPAAAQPAPESSTGQSAAMPGIQPTVIERMFGAN